MTLMNVLFGLLRSDSGSIAVAGRKVAMTSPAVAIEHGLIDRAARMTRTAALSRQFGPAVSPGDRRPHLSVAAEQRIEILRVLVRVPAW